MADSPELYSAEEIAQFAPHRAHARNSSVATDLFESDGFGYGGGYGDAGQMWSPLEGRPERVVSMGRGDVIPP